MLIENETQQTPAGKRGSSTFSQAQKEISQQEKFCAHEACKKKLVRKKGESQTKWARRAYCKRRCVEKSRRLPPGSKKLLRCVECNKKLKRRKGEKSANWMRRRMCNQACRMACLRKMDAVTKELPCSGCGVPQTRSSRFKTAKCPGCVEETRAKNSNAYRDRIRDEARQLRIIMGLTGFASFSELVGYLKAQNWTVLDGKRVRNLRGAA